MQQGKKLDTLDEIKTYINRQIENYIPQFISERFPKNDDVSVVMNYRYLGYISKRLKINNIHDLNQQLETIGIDKQLLYRNDKPIFEWNNKEFQHGIAIAKAFITEVNLSHFSQQSFLYEKNKSIKNIAELREKFNQNNNTNTTLNIKS